MSISAFPRELALRAASTLAPGIDVSITVRQLGVTVRAGSSSDAAARCDQAESLADDGPCIDAMDTQVTCVVPSVTDGQGWKAWRRQAAREGFVSALAVPASLDESIAVAVNLYSGTPARWTAEQQATAGGYARIGADMVRLCLARAELDDGTSGHYRRMSDLVVTEHAIGAIMQANDCPEHTARHVLESASLRRNISRRRIAETILRTLVVSDDPVPTGEGHEHPGSDGLNA
ncbi:ANTAR domain-containing protein [Promicromonospora sp. NPDC019610]|uniref:ANTAR domain-containing protein n=1 Tax=Promicromonospora sp. NPDC019610 TaxID=3364405 RepID=UPI0037A00597